MKCVIFIDCGNVSIVSIIVVMFLGCIVELFVYIVVCVLVDSRFL